MELRDLVSYAKNTYGIEEEHKWSDFPGFSVLCHPETGKWIALLMRQWDSETGCGIERCDIKCGSSAIYEIKKPYISAPVRMRGSKWVNIAFDKDPEADVVRMLIDRAVKAGTAHGVQIVLNDEKAGDKKTYRETLISFGKSLTRGFSKNHEIRKKTYREEQASVMTRKETAKDGPAMILRMISMYEYGTSSVSHRARNFYRQGKFMESYEDNKPWNGDFKRYFTTYHDLNIRQLRGYFTWRGDVRRGDFRPIATSLAYMYLYELLCGIGADTPEEALRLMKEFEKGYLDSGIGDEGMRRNLNKWGFEYSVIHGLPADTCLQFADPDMVEKDRALSVLKHPMKFADEEIVDALAVFTGNKLKESPVISKAGQRGRHLFAELWRMLSEEYRADNKNIFAACFGKQHSYRWYPLSNAVYYEEYIPADTDFVLNDCRSYRLRNGLWHEKRYEKLHFDKARLKAVIHEGDRLFRHYLKTGRYLKEKSEESWVTAFAESVIESDRRALEEAARPKINIDYSSLGRIRSDAIITRDSLLTDDEIEESVPATDAIPDDNDASDLVGLDALHVEILKTLLKGEGTEGIIRTNLLMPSVVADAINKAMFDEFGDNILECDGSTISLIEDYSEDVREILKGNNK